MRTLARALVALSLSAAVPAFAQTPPAEAPASTVKQVTVTAKRADAVNAFVAQISAPTTGTKQLARWDRTICSGVLGLPEKHAQYMNDRIALHAVEVGLSPGKPGCRANVLVMVTPEADAFVADIVRNHRKVFGDQAEEAGAAANGRKALIEFVKTPRAVRWWHITQTVTSDGTPIGDSVPTGDGVRPRSVNVHRVSRIRPDVRQDFAGVVIVVDAKRSGGVTYQALCDYISMVALAQLDPRADTTALPSILALFKDRDAGVPPPAALTEWDLSYLKGLYTVPGDARDAKHQEQDIAQEMKKDADKAEAKAAQAPK